MSNPRATRLSRASALVLLAAMAATTPALRAATYYVDVNWTSSPGSGTQIDPFDNIGSAVTAANAADGNIILVADGTYQSVNVAGGKETFGSSGHQITRNTRIYGGYAGWTGGTSFDWGADSRIPRSSVIDLTNAVTRAFYCTTHQKQPTIDGFSLINANHSLNGGTIYGTDNPATHGGFIIADCLFSNNVTTASGGGVYLVAQWSYNGHVLNCDFIGNQAAHGGGLFYYRTSVSGADRQRIEGSRFINNKASGNGGGFAMELITSGGDALIATCLFTGNSATGGDSRGGAIWIGGGNEPSRIVTLSNTIINANSAYRGGAVFAQRDRSIPLRFQNCLIYSNNATLYTVNAGDGTVGDTYRVDMLHTTLADNTGGGIYAKVNTWKPMGGIRVRNSILSNNGNYGIHFDKNNRNRWCRHRVQRRVVPYQRKLFQGRDPGCRVDHQQPRFCCRRRLPPHLEQPVREQRS